MRNDKHGAGGGRRWALLVAVTCGAWFFGQAIAANEHRPGRDGRLLQVEDLLDLESIKNTVVSPDRELIAFVHSGPFRLANRTPAEAPKAQLLLFSAEAPEGSRVREVVPGQGPDDVAGPIGFSPSGKRLAFHYAHAGENPSENRIGIYDVGTRQLSWIEASGRTAIDAKWIDDDTIVYSVENGRDLVWDGNPNTQLAQTYIRAYDRKWTRAISGREASVTVMESTGKPAGGTESCDRSSSVHAYNVLRKDSRQLTDYAVDGLQVVPGSRRLVGYVECGKVPLGAEFGSRSLRVRSLPALLDLDDGAEPFRFLCEQCTPRLGASRPLHLSGDGRFVAYFEHNGRSNPDAATVVVHDLDKQTQQDYRLRGLIAFDLDNTLDHNYTSPIVVHDGTPFIYARQEGPGERWDWYRLAKHRAVNLTAGINEERGYLHAAEGKLMVGSPAQPWIVDLKTNKAKTFAAWCGAACPAGAMLLPFAEDVVGEGAPTQAGWRRNPYVRLDVPGKNGTSLHWFDVRNRRIAGTAQVPAGKVANVLSAVNHRILGLASSEAQDTSLYYATASDAGAVMRINAGLADVVVPDTMDVAFTSPDGWSGSVCVVLPPKNAPRLLSNGKVPAIIWTYPTGGTRFGCPRRNGQALATWADEDVFVSKGYAYIYGAVPYVFRDPKTDKALDLAATYDEILKQVSAAVPIDMENIFVDGYSQATITALAALKDRRGYRAAAVGGFDNDYRHLWGGAYPVEYLGSGVYGAFSRFEPTYYPTWLGGTPMDQTDRYVAADPAFAADRIHTPLLMWIGEMDGFSPVGFENLYTALWRRGKEARYLFYWAEGHAMSSPANQEHNIRARLEWFDSHLAR
jgi:dipeptidyl aminopeptidase/acylaminoacyl peptidase